MNKSVLAAIVAGTAVTLFGCGGSGSGEDAGGSTSVPPSAVSPCKEGNDEACVKWLNELYMGYDETDPQSPLGISIHAEPNSDDWPFFYLTGECYNGQPDGYAAASLMNHKMMITAEGKPRLTMDGKLFVIFQPTAAEEQLTKCAYQYDGAAWNKFHGGCGGGASRNCDDPTSAFQNKCPEDQTKYADDTCPSVQQAECATEELDYPATCSWRGPAWYSPTHNGSEPDLSRLNEMNELRKMVEQRLESQSFENTTDDGKFTLTEYWNELTMDGRILRKLLDEDPTKVIAAFGYVKGDTISMGFAQIYNDNLFNDSQKRVPIVALDAEANIGAGGNFFTVAESTILSEQLV